MYLSKKLIIKNIIKKNYIILKRDRKLENQNKKY